MRRQHRDLKDVEAKINAISRHLEFAPNPGSPKDELSALSGSVSLDQLESLPVHDIGAAKHTLQLCWRELCGLQDHDSFTRANPRLPVNQAHIRVSDWLRRAEVPKLFEDGLSHSIPPSPDEFMALLTATHDHPYHRLRVEHPLEDAQDRISRMHRLAQRCAQLLGEPGRHEDAEKVLAMVERVYNDGFLAYQQWNHGQDVPILEQDDVQ
ncbi:hypothetical protein PG988_005939 [Apiospora saccharicola]